MSIHSSFILIFLLLPKINFVYLKRSLQPLISKVLKVPSRLPGHPGVTSILVFNRDNLNNQIKFDNQRQIDDIIENNRVKMHKLES